MEPWLAAVEADDGQPELRSLAAGIRNDQAVTNGPTLPYSSGKVEDTVNKMLKRQICGRHIRPVSHAGHRSPNVTREFAAEPIPMSVNRPRRVLGPGCGHRTRSFSQPNARIMKVCTERR